MDSVLAALEDGPEAVVRLISLTPMPCGDDLDLPCPSGVEAGTPVGVFALGTCQPGLTTLRDDAEGAVRGLLSRDSHDWALHAVWKITDPSHAPALQPQYGVSLFDDSLMNSINLFLSDGQVVGILGACPPDRPNTWGATDFLVGP